jgi:hypothetical protein
LGIPSITMEFCIIPEKDCKEKTNQRSRHSEFGACLFAKRESWSPSYVLGAHFFADTKN